MNTFTLSLAFVNLLFHIACNNSQIISNELSGGYGFEPNGRVQLNIIKEDGEYYLQFPGSNDKELMTPVSDSASKRILGDNWQNAKQAGLSVGAFFVFKVKPGSTINGQTISSGFYGALPLAGQIWKIN